MVFVATTKIGIGADILKTRRVIYASNTNHIMSEEMENQVIGQSDKQRLALVKLEKMFKFADYCCANMDMETLMTRFSFLTAIINIHGIKRSNTQTIRGLDPITLGNWQHSNILQAKKTDDTWKKMLVAIMNANSSINSQKDTTVE